MDHDHVQPGKRQKMESPIMSIPGRKFKPALLHEFFCSYSHSKGNNNNTAKATTNHYGNTQTAVIFDDGQGKIEELSYEELDHGANLVRSLLEKLLIAGKDNCCNGEYTQEFVGVNCDVGRLYPILILGILRSGNALFNIDPVNPKASLQDGVKLLGMKYVLTNENCISRLAGKCALDKVGYTEICVGGTGEPLSFHVYKIIANANAIKFPQEKFAYAIQTSGTTGEKKTVLVPHACICPNIEDFAENYWNLTPQDVIFGSAPVTFDPHIVELFSTLAAGATILYTTPEVKLNGNLLANLLSCHQVSILQITPSLFRKLFSARVHLPTKTYTPRIVAFGGETCPEKAELRNIVYHFPNLHNATFQNVYGVTEVSCWATVAPINCESIDPITIGNALKDTEITLDSETSGEIIINSSTRYCVILDPSTRSPSLSVKPTHGYHTGDLGVTTSNNGIIFQGRKDRVVKRNGMKVSLHQIEKTTLSTGLVSYAECTMKEGEIYLIVKMNPDSTSLGKTETCLFTSINDRLNLPLFMYPDHIVCLDDTNIPMNGNGKIDFTCIINSFQSLARSARKTSTFKVTSSQIIQTLVPIWKNCTHRGCRTEEVILLENFIAAGGTSISAARFVEAAFMAMKLFGSEVHQKWEQKLLFHLLNVETEYNFGGIVDTIMNMFTETCGTKMNICNLDTNLLQESQEPLPHVVLLLPKSGPGFEFDLLGSMHTSEDEAKAFVEDQQEAHYDEPVARIPLAMYSTLELTELYSFSMGLCVDASPAIVKTKSQAIIGCHGGVLLCLDLNVLRLQAKFPSLAIVWRKKLSNRIEATVEIHPNGLYAYVGCHDGNLYKISVSTGEIMCWASSSGGNNTPIPIRSKCAVSIDDLVITVDSANSIICSDAQSLNKIWTFNKFKLLATTSPVIFRRQCLLATLDHGIIAVENISGNVLWTTATVGESDLIYSSPVLVTLSGHSSIKRHHRAVIFCASNRGIEARDAKSGSLKWSQESSSSSLSSQVVFSECCNQLIWIDNVSSNLSIFKFTDPETGKSLGSFKHSHCGPLAPGLIMLRESDSSCKSYSDNHNRCADNIHCYLCYKSTMENHDKTLRPYFTVLPLHERLCHGQVFTSEKVSTPPHNKVNHVQQFEISTTCDFESFSRPIVCSEFILFGGRDNNLHVIKLKIRREP